jgi:MFS family permease
MDSKASSTRNTTATRATAGESTGSPGSSIRKPPPVALAWLLWSLAAALYLIAFYQRVAPAVITGELSRDFGLTAAALGNLSAFYFYGYVAVQIPTGLLADRWGPRRVLSLGAALTAAGTLAFALAPTLAWAHAGRLAIGAAGGVAFVSMLKLASHWMPARRFAFVSGMALVVGTLGATLGGAPLRMAVDAFGWRAVMVASAAVTALVAIAIWLAVRDDPAQRGYASYFPEEEREGDVASVGAHLREVARCGNVWLLFFVPGAFSGILLTFAGLWGVPFLISQHAFSPREAAAMVSAMLIAWAVSSLGWGWLSQRVGRRKAPMAAGMAATFALWSVVVFAPRIPRFALVVLLVALSMAAGAFVLNFVFAKESVPARLAGTVSGIANMGVMMGGMIMQPLVGVILDRHWKGAMEGGVRVYDFAAFQWAFAAVFAWGALALVLLALTRETYCRALR